MDAFFPDWGLGTTPLNDFRPGEGALKALRIAGNSSYANTTDLAQRKQNYFYQEITLEPATNYTISIWISRPTSNNNSSYWMTFSYGCKTRWNGCGDIPWSFNQYSHFLL